MSVRITIRELLSRFPLVDALFRRFVWSRIHFPEVEMQFLESLDPGSVDISIDVGAALGSYTWILSRKSASVYAFEPGPQHGDYLSRSVFGTNVQVVRAAVGSFCDTVAMYTPGSDTNALHSATLSEKNPVISAEKTQVRQVEQISLDSFFLNEIGVNRAIDILKVDVEGYEFEVFRGATELIARHHPLIFCEIEKRHDPEYLRTFDMLRAAGYRSYIYRGNYMPFDMNTIDHLQSDEALADRLSGKYDPAENQYANNFVFQHPQSRIKVMK